jgi:hypothetical protein
MPAHGRVERGMATSLSCGRRYVRASLLAAALVTVRPAAAADTPVPVARPAAAAGAQVTVAGRVTDPAGRPLAGVMVFAADAESDRIEAVVVTDHDGRAVLRLSARRHNFGVLSPNLGVQSLQPAGKAGFTLVLRPLPPVQVVPQAAPAPGGAAAGAQAMPAPGGAAAAAQPAPAAQPAAVIESPRALIVRGKVIDQVGDGLAGVRIQAERAGGQAVSTTFSGAGGAFAIAVPGGVSHLRVLAPGLRMLESSQLRGRVVVVMTVDAEPQQLSVNAGRMLTFRISDSIDPEYTPPAPVRAWLQFTYGVCASAGPLKARDRRRLKKYWYLDLLRREPPNPATISTSTCVSPGDSATLGGRITADFATMPSTQAGPATPIEYVRD